MMRLKKKKDNHNYFKIAIGFLAITIFILIFLFIRHINDQATESTRIYGDVYGNLSAKGTITGIHNEKEINLGITAWSFENATTNLLFNISNCTMVQFIDRGQAAPESHSFYLDKDGFSISIVNGTFVADLKDMHVTYQYSDFKGISEHLCYDYIIVNNISRIEGTAEVNQIGSTFRGIRVYDSEVSVNDRHFFFKTADITFNNNETPIIYFSGRGNVDFSKMPQIHINGTLDIEDFQEISSLGIKRDRIPTVHLHSHNIVLTTIRQPEGYNEPEYPWRILVKFPN